jgi:hypothetical protein
MALAMFTRAVVTRGTRVGRTGRCGACVDETRRGPTYMELACTRMMNAVFGENLTTGSSDAARRSTNEQELGVSTLSRRI